MSAEVKAVLVKITIRIFPNTRKDAEITEETRTRKALGEGAGKWLKNVFPEEAMQEIRATGGEARRRHYDLTLPWEEGYRLLPSKGHKAYEKELADYAEKFYERVAAFGKNYNDWIAKAKKMHNGTFDPSLYPAWREMEKKFSFEVEYTPVPKAAHFITNGIAKGAIDEMKEDLERRNNERVEAAVKDTWLRLMTPVKALSEKLADPERIFRDSLIENIKDIVNLIPQLNLTNDRRLEALAEEIKTLFGNLDAEALRDNVELRTQVMRTASDMVKHFGAVGKRRFA
jgi:hypothetical protein